VTTDTRDVRPMLKSEAGTGNSTPPGF